VGKSLVTYNQWYSVELSLDHVSLTNINVYAAYSHDRNHLDEFQIAFNDYPAPIEYSQNIEVEQYTIVDYLYDSQDFQCLISGVSGRVVGNRQYSFSKITALSLVMFYPATYFITTCLTILTDLPDLTDFLSPKVIIPLALLISPLIGKFFQQYPQYYRRREKQREWKDYKSQSSQFAYDFQQPFTDYTRQRQQQYQQESYSYQQQKQQSYRRSSRSQEAPPRQPPPKDQDLDLYQILAVSRTATEKEIKRAYLLKAKEVHPDRNPGDKQAEEKFKLVNQAYAILSDKNQRQQYDRYGWQSVKYK
ncbi:unnamed protein product, partial [Didymodactylos carnosus]